MECTPLVIFSPLASTSHPTLFSQHTKIILTHYILIHLGDLQRYKVELQNTSPSDNAYKEAETFYKQAIAFDPTNGDGHHKLAVIAFNSNCEYLALYRYCRALGCRTPYMNSLKNVKVLFTRNEKTLKNFGSPEKVTNWKDNREVQIGLFFTRSSFSPSSFLSSTIFSLACPPKTPNSVLCASLILAFPASV